VLASRESFLESKGRHFVDMYLKSITPIESKNNFLPPPRGRIKVGGKGPGCPPLSEPEAL
jgi:hypothetical protein